MSAQLAGYAGPAHIKAEEEQPGPWILPGIFRFELGEGETLSTEWISDRFGRLGKIGISFFDPYCFCFIDLELCRKTFGRKDLLLCVEGSKWNTVLAMGVILPTDQKRSVFVSNRVRSDGFCDLNGALCGIESWAWRQRNPGK